MSIQKNMRSYKNDRRNSNSKSNARRDLLSRDVTIHITKNAEVVY
jgi:hypothetical protein